MWGGEFVTNDHEHVFNFPNRVCEQNDSVKGSIIPAHPLTLGKIEHNKT